MCINFQYFWLYEMGNFHSVSIYYPFKTCKKVDERKVKHTLLVSKNKSHEWIVCFLSTANNIPPFIHNYAFRG